MARPQVKTKSRYRSRTVTGLATRRIAARLYDTVVSRRVALDPLLDMQYGDALFRSLIAKDRALARAIIATTLRRRGQIDDALNRLLSSPLPKKSGALKSILDIAAAQILFMNVADHAAVSLAVESAAADRNARHFKGLVNGVLRQLLRDRETIIADQDPEKLSTPEWLWNRWTASYGEDTARRIAGAHLNEAKLDLTSRDADRWAKSLGGTLLPTGTIRLDHSGRVEILRGYEEGGWWVQDAAASLPARLLHPRPGLRILDLCAAPGGKTAQLASAGADVTAVDSSKLRLDRLRANMKRLGLTVETITATVDEYTPSDAFDAVLLDAPCSATGTIRRHPDVGHIKREDNISKLATIQRRMLERAVSFVKPGGVLVYCTCSLEPEEGEDQVTALLNSGAQIERDPIDAGEICGLTECLTSDGELRTLPFHRTATEQETGGMDGFFAARLRRINHQ